MKNIIFLILMSLSLPTWAQRWFDVEIIVFKRDNAAQQEFWSNEPIKINFSNTINYHNADGLKRYDISLLKKSQLELTSQYNKLKQSGKYTGLLHTGWRQNDNGRSNMPKIRLAAGKNFADEFGSERPLFALDGYIRLYVQHYLFLETDLVLRKSVKKAVAPPLALPEPADDFEPVYAEDPVQAMQMQTAQVPPAVRYENILQDYAFKQKRRMRSGEIHYLDHPLMGIIIQVRKTQ